MYAIDTFNVEKKNRSIVKFYKEIIQRCRVYCGFAFFLLNTSECGPFKNTVYAYLYIFDLISIKINRL